MNEYQDMRMTDLVDIAKTKGVKLVRRKMEMSQKLVRHQCKCLSYPTVQNLFTECLTNPS